MRRPWVLRMRWTDLLFAHWPLDPAVLRPLIPPALEVETFEGQAWLGVVPFRMEDVAPRGLPAPPVLGVFPEVNVRTYVLHHGWPGVWFFSLDAASRPTVLGGRVAFHLPYFRAAMQMGRDGDFITYRSERTDDRGGPAELDVRYRPTGPAALATAGSLEAWLTDRKRQFAADDQGRISRTEIRHVPWSLQPAEADFRTETLVASHGLALPATPPHLRYAARLDVRGWWPRRA
ncbi:MAG: YqjF family protein [Candidatus Limnocylindrales bacterium]